MTQLWPPQRLWAVTKAANDGHRGNGIGAPRMVKISMRHSCNTSVVRQCARDNALDSAVSAAQPSRPGTGERCSFLDGSSPRETTQQHNTHITDVREICYSGHPWHGRAVRVHASLVKRGHAVAYCSLEDVPACRA